jgi:hypothetical protein
MPLNYGTSLLPPNMSLESTPPHNILFLISVYMIGKPVSTVFRWNIITHNVAYCAKVSLSFTALKRALDVHVTGSRQQWYDTRY